MEFVSTQKFESQAEQVLWDALKAAFATELGYCWHRYPITSTSGNRLEPDIVILHPKWGLNIIEVKGCNIYNIEAIEGHIWYMANGWSEYEMTPVQQAESHMWALIDRMKRLQNSKLRDDLGNCKIWGRTFIGLPFINEQEWKIKFTENITAPTWNVVFSTDLEPSALRKRFSETHHRQGSISEDEWKTAVAMLQGSEGIQRRVRRPTKQENSRAALLRRVEQQISAFDLQQHKVAVQVPEGPQRIRGLAGSGKTVVLAQKAAYMHIKYPDWDILFTFYSRSLYDQVRNLIIRFVRQLSQGEVSEPDWSKLRVWHAWGASKQPGFYREMAKLTQTQFMSFTNAKSYFGTENGGIALDGCCAQIMNAKVPEIFDAILIDEGQDFGSTFFQLCYTTLRQPHRIIWGYDEVQSLMDLEIPTAESLFGTNENGRPLVDLDGEYPGEIDKDMILYHCYRNPRPVLIAAHAFGLGLRRKEGPVQFIDTVGGWQDIGYTVKSQSENTLIAGDSITLYRPEENSPHLLEKLVDYHDLVSWQNFTDRDQEIIWIVNDIARNIKEEEVQPDEIAVIALDSRSRYTDRKYAMIKSRLELQGIRSVRIGIDRDGLDTFRVEGSVTITSAFRAKGNEASIVYVYGFENIGGSYDVIRNRNIAFTAMTRTRGWLILSGVGKIAVRLFQEIEAILERIGHISFIVPDMAKIQRNLETYENQRRRANVKKAEQSLSKLIQDLAGVNPDELSEEQKKMLYRLLFPKKKED